jgi:tetratricopeptide (TPR) repeat protein
MSGRGTFSGTSYQEAVIVYIAAHILARSPLNWGGFRNIAPNALQAETGGPGDDVRVEFGAKYCEVQAKHGLTGKGGVADVITKAAAQQPSGHPIPTILAVDGTASRFILRTLPGDLERIRYGNPSDLGGETKEILKVCGNELEKLATIFVVRLDFDEDHDPHVVETLRLLETVLVDRSQAAAALAVLTKEASTIARKGLRRSEADLRQKLSDAGIATRDLGENDEWHRRLDVSKALINRGEVASGLAYLEALAPMDPPFEGDPRLRYRFEQQQASAHYQLGSTNEAIKHALRALDIDPKGLHALAVAALCEVALGRNDTALALAIRAIDAHPGAPEAWAAAAVVASMIPADLPEPPAEVMKSCQYLEALARIAAGRGDFAEAAAITGQIISTGERSSGTLLLRAQVLLEGAQEGDQENLGEVVRLASEIIEGHDQPPRHIVAKSYLTRAIAKQHLRLEDDALSDIESAKHLDRDDINIIAHEAKLRLQRGEYAEAYECLLDHRISESPVLLGLRASARARLGSVTDAEADLSKALQAMAQGRASDEARLNLAETAAMIGSLEIGERLLQEVSDRTTNGSHIDVISGRIAFKRDLIDEAVDLYYRAAETASELDWPQIFQELGSQLVSRGEFRRAIDAFARLPHHSLSDHARRHYTMALVSVGDFEAAHQVIESIALIDSLPEWATAIGVDIAMAAGDDDSARQGLFRLAASERYGAKPQLALARLGIETGDLIEANAQINSVIAKEGIPLDDRLQIVGLLIDVDRGNEAVALAYECYREARGDATANRALISAVFNPNVNLDEPEAVDVGTSVVFADEVGDESSYTVVPNGTAQSHFDEIDVARAESMGLLGKRVGESLVRNEGDPREQNLKIAKIVAAPVFASQRAAQSYQHQFPGEPFFVTMFHIGADGSGIDASKLVVTTEARRNYAEELLSLHREHFLPIGAVAERLNVRLSDVVNELVRPDSQYGPRVVDGGDSSTRGEGLTALERATSMVLTRSTLETLARFKLLETVSGHFSFEIPASLGRALLRDVRIAELSLQRGERILGHSAAGLTLFERVAGDEGLKTELEALVQTASWVSEHCRAKARPLTALSGMDAERIQMREVLGGSDYDAIELGLSDERPVCIDDYALAALARHLGVTSVSTFTLIDALVLKGRLSPDERDDVVLDLIEANHVYAEPTVSLLLRALRRQAITGVNTAARLSMRSLTGPNMVLDKSIELAVALIRELALADVRPTTIGELTRNLIDALAVRWRAKTVASRLRTEAAKVLLLLPRDRDEVSAVCREYMSQ